MNHSHPPERSATNQLRFVLRVSLGLTALRGSVLAQTGAPSPPAIRDITPPIDVFPYPPWMIATAAGLALLLVALAGWLVVRAIRRRPAPPQPTPQEIALQRLEAARRRLDELPPYEFSILLSDILRSFVAERYGLRATRQTSPEFLNSLSRSAHFTHGEKTLLEAFLEKCDLIKFARIEATREDSAALLEQAITFVKGSGAVLPAESKTPPPFPA